MNPLQKFAQNFQLAGNVKLEHCPVCGSGDFAEIWRLPQTHLDPGTTLHRPGSSYHGYYLGYLPTLRVPQKIFVFDICGHCESIFLNPKNDDQDSYTTDTSKVESFRTEGLDGFRDFVKSIQKIFPENTRVVVDAACGSGQVLALLKEKYPQLELIGLDLSRPSVDFMNKELGIRAYAIDLDRDDLDALLTPGSVDCVLMNEAFEHLRDPLTVMRKMTRLLRPGGRLYFTAQYYGDNSLQIRTAEPIYINQHGFDYVVNELGLQVHRFQKDVKIRATLEKRG